MDMSTSWVPWYGTVVLLRQVEALTAVAVSRSCASNQCCQQQCSSVTLPLAGYEVVLRHLQSLCLRRACCVFHCRLYSNATPGAHAVLCCCVHPFGWHGPVDGEFRLKDLYSAGHWACSCKTASTPALSACCCLAIAHTATPEQNGRQCKGMHTNTSRLQGGSCKLYCTHAHAILYLLLQDLSCKLKRLNTSCYGVCAV